MKAKYLTYNEENKTEIQEDLIIKSFYAKKVELNTNEITNIPIEVGNDYLCSINYSGANKEYRGLYYICRLGGGNVVGITKIAEQNFGGVTAEVVSPSSTDYINITLSNTASNNTNFYALFKKVN